MSQSDEANDEQVRRLRLIAEFTAALNRSKLRWPEDGQVVAQALTNWLGGNPVALRVHADGCINYFDGETVTGRTDTPEGMAKEFLDAMPGKTHADRFNFAMGMLKKVAGYRE